MAYQKDVLAAVLREMEQGRSERERELAERRQTVYAGAPRVRQIDRILQSTAAQVIRVSLESGKDPTEAVSALRERNLTLQEERRQLIRSLGLPRIIWKSSMNARPVQIWGILAASRAHACVRGMHRS